MQAAAFRSVCEPSALLGLGLLLLGGNSNADVTGKCGCWDDMPPASGDRGLPPCHGQAPHRPGDRRRAPRGAACRRGWRAVGGGVPAARARAGQQVRALRRHSPWPERRPPRDHPFAVHIRKVCSRRRFSVPE